MHPVRRFMPAGVRPIERMRSHMFALQLNLLFPGMSSSQNRFPLLGDMLTVAFDRFAAIRTTKCPINQTGDVLRRRPISTLAAQAETADQRLITRFVNALDIVEKATTLRNQLQEAATRMIVILVALEVFGEVGDTLGKNGNLYFRRTGVAFLGGVFLDKCLLALSSNRHRNTLSR